jgi:hypothetical protein
VIFDTERIVLSQNAYQTRNRLNSGQRPKRFGSASKNEIGLIWDKDPNV